MGTFSNQSAAVISRLMSELVDEIRSRMYDGLSARGVFELGVVPLRFSEDEPTQETDQQFKLTWLPYSLTASPRGIARLRPFEAATCQDSGPGERTIIMSDRPAGSLSLAHARARDHLEEPSDG